MVCRWTGAAQHTCLECPFLACPTLKALQNYLLPTRPQPSEGQQPAAATPQDRQSGPPPPTEAPAEALPAPSAPSAASSPTQAQAEAGSISSEPYDSAPLETGSQAAAAPCAATATTNVSACSIPSCEFELGLLSLQLQKQRSCLQKVWWSVLAILLLCTNMRM